MAPRKTAKKKPPKHKPGIMSKYNDKRPAELIKLVKGDKKTHGSGLFIGGAAIEMDIKRQTFDNWRKLYPEFEEAYELCKEIVRDRLVTRGLDGTYKENFTKWILEINYPELRERDDWYKKAKIELERKELDGKLKGKIRDDRPIQISFIDKVERDKVEKDG
jgi:hypothetical protein